MEAQVWTLIALLGFAHVATIVVLGRQITRLETRFDHLEARFDHLEARFDHLEARFDRFLARIEQIDRRADLRRHAG